MHKELDDISQVPGNSTMKLKLLRVMQVDAGRRQIIS